MYISSSKQQALTQQQRNNRRKRASPRQLAFLRKKFQEDPKPDQVAREIIGRQIDMTPRSVQIWFQNNRAKARVQEKRLASLYNPPIITSSCGENVSRVHLDLDAMRDLPPRLYGHVGFSASSPSVTTGRSLDDRFMGSWIGTETLNYPRDSHAWSSTPEPSDSFFNIPFSARSDTLGYNLSPPSLEDLGIEESIYQRRDSITPVGGENVPDDTFDFADASQDLGGYGDQDSDFSEFSVYELWGLQIGNWEAASDGVSAAMSLHFSNALQTARILIDTSLVTFAGGPVETSKRLVALECEVRRFVRVSKYYVRLELNSSPVFYHARNPDAALVSYSSDFTGGEAFSTGQFILYGELGDLAYEPMSPPPQPAAEFSLDWPHLPASAEDGIHSGTHKSSSKRLSEIMKYP